MFEYALKSYLACFERERLQFRRPSNQDHAPNFETTAVTANNFPGP